MYDFRLRDHQIINMMLKRNPPEVFYHGTTEKGWLAIQNEGTLFGRDMSYRHTYLTEERAVAEVYAKPVLLEVLYVPVAILGIDNYEFSPPEGQQCWQFSVLFLSLSHTLGGSGSCNFLVFVIYYMWRWL